MSLCLDLLPLFYFIPFSERRQNEFFVEQKHFKYSKMQHNALSYSVTQTFDFTTGLKMNIPQKPMRMPGLDAKLAYQKAGEGSVFVTSRVQGDAVTP